MHLYKVIQSLIQKKIKDIYENPKIFISILIDICYYEFFCTKLLRPAMEKNRRQL